MLPRFRKVTLARSSKIPAGSVSRSLLGRRSVTSLVRLAKSPQLSSSISFSARFNSPVSAWRCAVVTCEQSATPVLFAWTAAQQCNAHL